MLVALIGPAFADPNVVHVGDAAPAVALVADRASLPADDLEPAALADLLTPRVWGAPVQPCEETRMSPGAFRAALDGVVATYDEGRLEEARTQAVATWDHLACLDGPLDPADGWRAGFLAGVTAWAVRDEVAARAWWSRARAFDPLRGWDDDFAPRGGALEVFATALPGPATLPLRVLGEVAVDGGPAPPSLAPGPHVLQAGEPLSTWLVEVTGPVFVVDPRLGAAEVSGFAADPTRHADLCAVLGAALPDERVVYLVNDGAVYRVEPAAGGVREVLGPPPPPAAPRREGRGWWVALAGGGTLLLGASVDAAIAWPRARDAARAGDAATTGPAWDDARADWESARTWLVGGYVAGGAGSALIVAGSLGVALGQRGNR